MSAAMTVTVVIPHTYCTFTLKLVKPQWPVFFVWVQNTVTL